MNRVKDSPVFGVEFFMFRYRAREAMGVQPLAQPMRIARPGERPPSARPPGINDNIIERFDAYAKQQHRGPHAR